jgi:hypothetical protein
LTQVMRSMTSKPATKVSSAVFSLEYSDVFGFDTVKCNYAMNGGEVTASYGEAVEVQGFRIITRRFRNVWNIPHISKGKNWKNIVI